MDYTGIIAGELIGYLVMGLIVGVFFFIGKVSEFVVLIYQLYIKDKININERLKEKLKDKNKKL